ncbi:hypothetical protein CTI12_AA206360 [Artemisia annua]|uniref:Uncharacterized protein n=1 Tax=Artemisia annua TaxID=35608 RepID=A0A2U1P127_ARTAN|nr:hypothetical protein CTI12_AA206360 [Artemisia annua]
MNCWIRFPRTGSRTGEELSGFEPVRAAETWNRTGFAGYSWNQDRILPEPVLTGYGFGFFSVPVQEPVHLAISTRAMHLLCNKAY